jgi:hypothetical protein
LRREACALCIRIFGWHAEPYVWHVGRGFFPALTPTPSMRLFSACVFGGFAAAVSASAQDASSQYAFSTIAGRAFVSGAIDGPGLTARFNRPWGIAVDAQGNIYVTEAVNHLVRKITPDGTVSTVAGRVGEVGSEDGSGTAARFAAIGTNPLNSATTLAVGPFGITVDDGGNAFVADGNSHVLRRITPSGLVTTYSGISGTEGFRDGPAMQALYRNPVGTAVDAVGNVFVADTYNHVIRRISAAGTVTTVAGNVGVPGSTDGAGSAARFVHPTAIAVSPSGDVFVADCNNVIRRLSRSTSSDTWSVVSIAGLALTFGTTDATGSDARFGAAPTVSPSGGQTVTFPSFAPILSPSASPSLIGTSYRLGDLPGLAADAAGNVYVSDLSNNTIRKISPSGVVTTIGGSASGAGAVDGVGTVARFQRPCGIAVDVTGALYIADLLNHTIRKGALAVPPVITAQTGSQTVAAGANLVLSVTATGSPPPAYQWSRNGAVISGATASTFVLNNVQVSQAGAYTVIVSNAVGSTFTIPQILTVVSPPPVFTTQPSSRNVLGGEAVTLTAVAAGSPAVTYQWTRDGVPLEGQTNASLVLKNVQEVHAGAYRVIASNPLGTTTSNAAVVAVDTGRIVNLSIRSTLVGSEALIAGFVVAGGTKSFLIRAAGPALRQFGVENAVPDPHLALVSGTAAPFTNDNWSNIINPAELSNAAAQVGAFPLVVGSLDSAALTDVNNNAVTAQAAARNNTGGIVLLELFETSGASVARLVNVSTRARVGIGENALFAGFVLGGNSPRTLLIRAIGPTLGSFGVSGTLADPLLEIYATGANTPRASNDNWNGDAALTSVFPRVSAFPLPATSSRDAALLITLPPGSYSARVAGVGDTVGEVLVEIYEVP